MERTSVNEDLLVKLTLVVSSLRMGGAERVLSMLANHWCRSGHLVTVITLEPPASDIFQLESGIARVTLDKEARRLDSSAAVIRASVSRIRMLRRTLVRLQPDVVLSFGDVVNVFTLVAAVGVEIPVIISERVDPRYHHIRRHWALLRRLLYRRAAALVVQTEALRSWAEGMMQSGAVSVIPNPLSLVSVPADELRSASMKRSIVAMGRLSEQKGFDVLIRAFARVHTCLPGWCVTIFGDGPARSSLEALVRDLGLANVVTLPGSTRTPGRELACATMFVLSSRYEGFPNVLLEAMAAGLPVIATDCPSGPAEIVQNEISGLLIPPDDELALADAILRLATDESLRQRLGSTALQGTQRFRMDRIAGMWEETMRWATVA